MSRPNIAVVLAASLATATFWPAPATALANVGESIAAVPQDTASFVTYCHDHMEVCTNAVTDVENEALIKMLYGKYGCTYPKPGGDTRDIRHLVRVADTGKILVWLEANSASRLPTTREAINQATAVLWPSGCQQGGVVIRAP